jgi:hypothetical protein
MSLYVDINHLLVVALAGVILGILTGKLSARWIFVGFGLSFALLFAG